MKNRFFKLLFLLSFFLSSSLFGGSVKFSKFAEKQMSLIKKINDLNATKEGIQDILKEQNTLYLSALNAMMAKKNRYINNVKTFDSEIFALKKIISINKHAGNNYAVLRDEVALKSYLVLRYQNEMIKDILLALNAPTKEEYNTLLNQSISQNQEKVNKLYEKDYKDILSIYPESRLLKLVKENIEDFYTLKEYNSDVIVYLSKFEAKMYRLNKYSKYHLISVVIYINSLDIVEVIDPILEIYGLNVIKLLFILFLVAVIYFFRKIVYVSLQKYILQLDIFKTYSRDIFETLRRPIENVIIIININMIIYVYNDFSSYEFISKFFNMLYGFYFTLFMYKIVNTIANVKLSSVPIDGSNIKNDLVNVGMKIINFLIAMIGLLIILFFAGVNLTAVLSGLGIGGFAVAFAAKDTISNFFGTLSILFSDVFSQGDWIEIDGKQGVVVEIGLRVTTIRTFDNALIAIPNGTFASKDVKNWNKRILGRRIKMHIGVKYDSKSEDIKNAVAEIRDMLDKHSGIATKATKYTHFRERSSTVKLVSKDDLEGVKNNLLVYLDNFGDSSINILIYCFSKSVKWDDWLSTKEDVMHKIMAILEKNNLEFAFPSLSVYNEKMS
jgi:MscS family membrane protein